MTYCYLCPNELDPMEESHVLVRLDDAMDDTKMWHGDYHGIKICEECNKKLEERIKKEENEYRRRIEQWREENPHEAYTLAQTIIDNLAMTPNGLAIRDIVEDEK